jgi:thioredoxin 1
VLRLVLPLVLLVSCASMEIATPPSKPTLLAFQADWCEPCRRDKPKLKELEKKFNVIRIDVDKNKDAVKDYQVKTIPLYVVLRGGNETYRTNNINSLEKK